MSRSTVVAGSGTARYKITRTGHSYNLTFWCNCAWGPHWHQLSDHRRKREAEAAIDVAEAAKRLVAP